MNRSTSIFTFEQTGSLPEINHSYPRRRVSLSVVPSPTTPKAPAPHSRFRSRTMSSHRQHTHSSKPPTSRSKKIIITILILLALFLLGTVIVLSSVKYYLNIPTYAYLTEDEVAWRRSDAISQLSYEPEDSSRIHPRQEWEDVSEKLDPDKGVMGADTIAEVWEELEEVEGAEEGHDEAVGIEEEESLAGDGHVWDVDGQGTGGYWMRKDWDGTVQNSDSWERLFNVSAGPGEKIPRLIHQTWKDDHLPEKWRKAWKECREGMPDYEYMLWTDGLARDFVEQNYPAFLQTFDSYKYPIQRADSIRYFVLNHFGGIYMDLDIGCRRRMDSLLQGDWEVILPITKPVGVSNDLIFSSKGSAFMEDAVHALPAFNHEWFSNYPTVMFSTGPMFLSAQYTVYSSAHPLTDAHPRAEVRILPKSLYGKNAPSATVPHAFFSHFYGSSWHDDDAGFVTFLGAWGKKLMYVGGVVILLGTIRLAYVRWTGGSNQQYQPLPILPISAFMGGTQSGSTTPTGSSGTGSTSLSPTLDQLSIPGNVPSDIASAFRRAGNLILAVPASLIPGDRRQTGLLYFVPTMFQSGPSQRSRARTSSEASQFPLRTRSHREHVAPPPYDDPPSDQRDETMDEVDAFLKDSDASSRSTERASDVTVKEAEWPEWKKDVQN